MGQHDELIDLADKCLDGGHFTDAINAYRSAMQLAPPSASTMFNFHVAETQQRLRLFSELIELHPTSLTSKLALAAELLREKKWSRVVALCSELLSEMATNGRDAIRVRRLRFSAALHMSLQSVLQEDFEALWKLDGLKKSISKRRAYLLREIASLDGVDAIRPIESLLDLIWISGPVRALLTAKRRELQHLERTIVTLSEQRSEQSDSMS